MPLHTIVEHDTTHIKPYIDAKDNEVKQALTNYDANTGVKNILQNNARTQTLEGVTYTINSDGSILANGTANNNSDLILTPSTITLKKGSYILSGGVDGGGPSSAPKYKLQVTNNTYGNIAQVFDSTPTQFTLEADQVCYVRIRVYSGETVNGTFYPMIRDANITDPTYQPYAKTNVELTKDDSGLTANEYMNGAVNLFKSEAVSNVTSGITIIANADGTITFANTSNDSIWVNVGYVTLPAGTYKVSGCPAGGKAGNIDNAYRVAIEDSNDGGTPFSYSETGDGLVFTLAATQKVKYRIRVGNATNMNGKVFKPMITVANMPNSDYSHYVPYAMTNRELTDEFVSTKWETITGITGVILSGRNVGDVVSINVQIPTVSFTASTWNDIATGIASKFIPLAERRVVALISGGTMCYLRVTAEGKIQVYPQGESSGSMSFTLTYIR